jgi:hypothetical protein
MKAQVTSKNLQFQEEKISERRKARSQVTSEKSSKNYISLFGGKPARGLSTPPPTSPRAVTAHFTRGGQQSVNPKCESYSRDSLAGGGGRAGEFCETVPFVNWSSDRLQTQNQDSQYYSAPLLFRQDLSISYWWLLASFGAFIKWRETIKGSWSQWPALSRLHYVLQSTPLWRKEVGHSNTHGTVRLCYFLLKYCCTLSTFSTSSTSFNKFMTSTVKRSLVSIVHINS